MVFSTVESSITKSGQALGIFKKDWHDVIYDIQNTSGIANKIKAAFSTTISSTDLDAIKKYNTEIKNGVTSQTAFNRCMLNTSSAAQNLVASANGATVSEETLTVATKRLTLVQKAGIAISKAFGTALNIALNVGVTLAISAIITGIEEIVNKQQESIEKIKEQAESGKTLVKDIGNLRKQYYELSNQVNLDSTAKQNLSNVTDELLKRLGLEGESIDYLIKKYGTLDNAINKTTLDTLQTTYSSLVTAYGEAEKALYNTSLFKNPFGEVSIEHIAPDIAKFIKESEFSDLYDGEALIFDISNKDEVINTYETIDKLIKELNKNFSANDLKNLYVYDQLTILYGELSDNIKTYNTAISDLNKNLSEQQIITYLQGNTLPKTKDEFDSFIDTIVKTSIASEKFIGTEEEIKNSITAVLQSMPEFNDFFIQEQTDVQNTTDSIYKLKQATEELKTALDETFSNQSTIQSAFDKIQEGSSLSADEVRKLIELCPQLATEFVKTADGYTIGADKLIEANESVVESTKQSLQERANYLRDFINNDYDTSTISGEASAKAHNEWKQSVEKAKTELEGLDLILSMFGLTANDTVDKVKELSDKYNELSDSTSKLVGKAKTLSSAFAEQNENGSLSTETVLSLIENGYAAALMYDKTTGAIRLNAEAYIALATAEIEAQIADLETQKAIADTSAIEAKKSIVSNLGWSYLGAAQSALELARAETIINNAEADVSNYDAKIKALEEYKNHLNDITNGTYGGSGGGSNTDPNKEAFDTANNLRKHWLAMGKDKTGKKYTEEMYYAWLDSADGYKKYFSDLTKYTDEYRQYEEEIYKWKKQQDQELFDRNIENIEKLAEKSLNGELPEEVDYTNPLDKFNVAKQYYNEAITEIQNRINELIKSGSGNVQDEINTLKNSLEEFKDKLKDISDEEFEVKITTWENTNGYNDKDINSRTDRSNYVRTLIEEYYNLNSEEYEKYIGEIEEFEQETYKLKVENEKTYWENQQKALEDYYDNEIKKLQDVADEEERITKQKELQLNLIKAQQELLDAKKNRNQLLFANGGFYYDYDQEAVQKAQENIANAEKDVANNIRDTQIEDLENEKESRSQWLKKLIDKIDEYLKMLNGEVTPTESDTSILNDVIKATDGKDSGIKTFTSLSQLLDSMGKSYNKEAVNKIDNDSTASKQFFNNISKTPNVPILTPVVNKNTINNNNSNTVNIQNMTITCPEGTTEEQVQAMIDQFASGVISTVRAKRAKLQ